MAVTQANRLLSLTTPLAEDLLLIHSVYGQEEMSRLFEFELEMLAENEKAGDVDPDALLGQKVTFTVALTDDLDAAERRAFTGIVSRFQIGGKGERFTTFSATVVSWTWLMGLKKDCRIFQDMTIPDVIKAIFDEMKGDFPDFVDFQDQLSGSYSPVDYLIQYNESTLDFVCRLMQEAGIFYYFEHTDDGHVLILADQPGDYPSVGAPKRFAPKGGYGEREGSVLTWAAAKTVRPGTITQRDNNFQMPSKTLEVSATTKFTAGGNDKLEVYEYPGGFASRFNKPDERMGEVESEGQTQIEARMEALEASHKRANGTSDCRDFTSGHQMELTEHEADAGTYVLTSVTHSMQQSPDYDTDSPVSEPYTNDFSCQPDDVSFRPECSIPCPKVCGVQRAVVVGPDGEEIFTDKYGRIKVQFPWDRLGEPNEGASCYIRCLQPWAGRQWGAFFWPRIGDEVLVDFIDGDLNQPIVVGSLYNAENMPPYTMPDNQTRTGIKTRSTKEGTEENFNEIRFEDKKDEEEIYFHAERDFHRVVENNDKLEVGFEKKEDGDQEITIFNNQMLTVGNSESSDGSQTIEIYKDRSATIKTGDDTLTVEQGNLTVGVQTGNVEATVDQGNVDLAVAMGNVAVGIDMGNLTIELPLGKVEGEAMQSIEFKVGSSSVKIDQMGVTIKGMMVKVEGTTMTEVKGMMTQIKGDAMLKMQGGLTMIN